MSSIEETPRPSNALVWIGRVISTLPVLMLIMSATMKFLKPAPVVEGFAKLGYPESTAFGLGVTEIVCTILYVIPQTSVLGAILLTGYLGGATATHVRIGDPFHMPIILGVMLWGGLWLRYPRLRSLIPILCRNPR